jgi:DNA sulfur modification protein DndD
MNIKRIRIQNFKTYLSLDLVLGVNAEKPLILIGGANGGGKTTLYEAIKGALYGIDFKSQQNFIDQVNVSVPEREKAKILLEAHFEGYLQATPKDFIITRVYCLNTDRQRTNSPVAESVCLKFDGTEYKYGTFTPASEKQRNKAIIDKVINANLPRELSRYFLFDALEAKNLLEERELSQVIKDNIENVMGFKKYILLHDAAKQLYQENVARRQKDQDRRKEYESLIQTSEKLKSELEQEEKKKNELEKSLAELEPKYQAAMYARQQNQDLQAQIQILEREIKALKNQEKELYDSFSQNVAKIDENIAFPFLQESLAGVVENLLKQKEELEKLPIKDVAFVKTLLLEAVTGLQEKYNFPSSFEPELFVQTVLNRHMPNSLAGGGFKDLNLFENAELKELENLRRQNYNNRFPELFKRKKEWQAQKANLPELEEKLKSLQESVSEDSFSLIQEYEIKQKTMRERQEAVNRLKREMEGVKGKLATYEIHDSQEEDKEFRALEKLQTFFQEVYETLLQKRKTQIEENMARYLNQSLYAYQNVIDRVELSTLPNLNFKIYHKQGNEISLEQLNTASKQIVVQVLLKVLHEYGDYSPPILIDTVMGALDTQSKSIMLESFFPSLGHQTILLSSDSEINPQTDYPKIKDYVAQSFTLVRDRDKQCTRMVEGYFEKSSGYAEA